MQLKKGTERFLSFLDFNSEKIINTPATIITILKKSPLADSRAERGLLQQHLHLHANRINFVDFASFAERFYLIDLYL